MSRFLGSTGDEDAILNACEKIGLGNGTRSAALITNMEELLIPTRRTTRARLPYMRLSEQAPRKAWSPSTDAQLHATKSSRAARQNTIGARLELMDTKSD